MAARECGYQRVQVFVACAVMHPTLKEYEESGATGAIVPLGRDAQPFVVLAATNEEQASALAGRLVPEDLVKFLGQRLEVVIRPF